MDQSPQHISTASMAHTEDVNYLEQIDSFPFDYPFYVRQGIHDPHRHGSPMIPRCDPANDPDLMVAQLRTPKYNQTFKQFSLLPDELKELILGYALPEGTTFALIGNFSISSNDPIIFKVRVGPWLEMYLPQPNNAIRTTAFLRVSKFTRAVYLARYPHALPFSSDPDDSDMRNTVSKWAGGLLRFGPKDVIYIDNILQLCDDRRFWRITKDEDWVKHVTTLCINRQHITNFNLGQWVGLFKLFCRLKVIQTTDKPYTPSYPYNFADVFLWGTMDPILELIEAKGIKGLTLPEFTKRGGASRFPKLDSESDPAAESDILCLMKNRRSQDWAYQFPNPEFEVKKYRELKDEAFGTKFVSWAVEEQGVLTYCHDSQVDQLVAYLHRAHKEKSLVGVNARHLILS